MDDCLVSLQGVPLLYVPLEVVVSKYYGESERLLASIFTAGNELPEGAIIFLDEVNLLLPFLWNWVKEIVRFFLKVAG
jgi:SpoVK/Ycf46/Vps4 family AAA+-type ATPase